MSLILHHYPQSPFSEKVRAMLGYVGVDWSSCLTSEAPPRGKLDLLSGGYNRIPVAQIGSDIFCDSNLIADEIAQMSNKPILANEALTDEKLGERKWLETTLFFACINKAFSPSLLRRIAKEKGLMKLVLFLKDRIEMGTKASISMGSPKTASRYIQQGMDFVIDNLESNDYLGGQQPSILDFAAYHCFWFLREVGQKKDIGKSAPVLSWYLRMKAFSQAPHTEISIEDALKAAKDSSPRVLSEHYTQDHRIGSNIVVCPSDYRQVPVSGTLVGVDNQRWIIARNTPETGLIHLHFSTSSMNVTIRLIDQ